MVRRNTGVRLRLSIFSICLSLMIFVLSLQPLQAKGAPGVPLKDKYQNQAGQNTVEFTDQGYNETTYSDAKQEYKKEGYKPVENANIELGLDAITASSKGDIPTQDNVEGTGVSALVWTDDYDWFDWSVDVPQGGLYEISMEYYPIKGTGAEIQREIMIDGKVPFLEARNIGFQRIWKNAGKPRVNSIGDEVRPKQIEAPEWRNVLITDSQGLYSEPLQFYFSAGKHTIRMNYVNEPAAFGKMILKTPKIIPSYQEKAAEYQQKGYKDAQSTIKFQGEDAQTKSDPTVRQETNGDPMVEPAAKGNIKLNVLGDWRWRTGDQSVTWDFDVPEDGLYQIGLRVGQWWGDGLPSYRQIAIDGEVPFSEMAQYAFSYQRDWRVEALHDGKNVPYKFYLTKGKHQLTMTVKIGPVRDVVHELTVDAFNLSQLIRKIIMITGSEPDPNFQYELDKKIPGLIDELKTLSGSMQKQIDTLNSISIKKPSVVNNFVLIRQELSEMIKNPDSISRKLQDLQNAQTSIGNWLMDLQNQPLVIDYFMIAPPNKQLANKQSTIIQKVSTTWSNFVHSFYKDYDSVGDVYSEDGSADSGVTLNVWMARGKEWVEIMKEMADEDFTPKTGIRVNMNVLPGGQLNAGSVNTLLLSITSNKAPDVACGVDANSPVEFAIRNATVNLKQFKDYSEVEKRFLPGVMIPFQYQGGSYALPETMDFNVLFYRKDITSELGIPIPQTWDDVYKNVLPILKQNGMDFYYPLGANAYLPFLYQNKGEYYRDNGLVTGLDEANAYKSFKEWTELYTNYRVPVQANFFNRMRSGEIPMGVGGYWDYVLLSTAAPELFGRWGIAPMPGHKRDDGTIDRTAGGAPQTSIILKQSKHQKEAWEFLKWWTSADVQAQFGRELESLLGVQARWNTANLEAFKELPWKKDDMKVITDQWNWYKEQPVVLGGYFTPRHVNNAWNRVVMGEMIVRDSLEKAVKDINKELKAKQEQYGVKPKP